MRDLRRSRGTSTLHESARRNSAVDRGAVARSRLRGRDDMHTQTAVVRQ
jgi:hypothetical protein